mgnify:CR=1 FL=1
MIYGQNIRLRPVEKADLPRFVAWFQDPEVRHGLTVILPMSLEQEEKWFQRLLDGHPNNAAQQPFSIDVRRADDTWQHIGSAGLHEIDWRNRSTELGIMIGDKSYWNQGYGSDVLYTLLEFGFDTLNLHRIWLQVYANNPRAVRAYEKTGFVHEGAFRESRFHAGKYYDTLIISVLRPEWQGRPAA